MISTIPLAPDVLRTRILKARQLPMKRAGHSTRRSRCLCSHNNRRRHRRRQCGVITRTIGPALPKTNRTIQRSNRQITLAAGRRIFQISARRALQSPVRIPTIRSHINDNLVQVRERLLAVGTRRELEQVVVACRSRVLALHHGHTGVALLNHLVELVLVVYTVVRRRARVNFDE